MSHSSIWMKPHLISICDLAAVQNIILNLSLTMEISYRFSSSWSSSHWSNWIASSILIHDILLLHPRLTSDGVIIVIDVSCLPSYALGASHA